MALYRFSALSDGHAITFNPDVDVLKFDRTTIAAADIRVIAEGPDVRVTVVSGIYAGKDVLLRNVDVFQLATSNVTFANGSKLLFGDNSTGLGDDGSNSLLGTSGRDFLSGFDGDDTLNGGAGADRLDGGLGNDTYIVSSGDILSDAGGIDHVQSKISWTLGSAFENLTLIGTNSINGVGNSLDNVIVGNQGNNSITGYGGNDALYGGAGNDVFEMSIGSASSYGSDFIDGGTGIDLIDFAASARSAVLLNLAEGTASGGGNDGAGAIAFSGIENVFGGAYNDVLSGSEEANRLSGSAGDDQLAGNGGDDWLDGGPGTDTLLGGVGHDGVTGGDGADTFVYAEAPGSGNADVITDFVSGSDKLVLDGTVHASSGPSGDFSAGDPRFLAGAGATGGQDANTRVIYDLSTGDIYYDRDGSGPAMAERLATLSGAPTLAAGDITVINGSSTSDGAINGTPGDDDIRAGDSDDVINGLEGNDLVLGRAGNDTISGQDGNDWLAGQEGNDRLDGGEGVDRLYGGTGSDFLSGGAGDDVLTATFADFLGLRPTEVPLFVQAPLEGDVDILDGGSGDDIYIVIGNVILSDPSGTDTVFAFQGSWELGPGFENLGLGYGGVGLGNELDNVITGTNNFGVVNLLDGADGNDTLIGGGGYDTFRFAAGSGNIGHDHVDGGGPWMFILDGIEFHPVDSLDYSGARSGVSIDLRSGTGSGGGDSGSGSVTFTNIDAVIGSAFDDHLIAHDGALYGYAYGGAPAIWGDPSIDGYFAGAVMFGGEGNDTLVGGASTDTLYGESGQDSFVFVHSPNPANADLIMHFVSGTDKLQLDDASHADLGALGDFTADDPRLWAEAGATSGHDADDRIVYNTSTGELYYDFDGSGFGDAQLFATLSGAPGLNPTDVCVI